MIERTTDKVQSSKVSSTWLQLQASTGAILSYTVKMATDFSLSLLRSKSDLSSLAKMDEKTLYSCSLCLNRRFASIGIGGRGHLCMCAVDSGYPNISAIRMSPGPEVFG